MKLFVAGLPLDLDNEELKEIFDDYGKIISAIVILDRETSKSRGFGFVDFENDTEAEIAMKKLNGGSLEGNLLTVKLAREKPRTTSNKKPFKVKGGSHPSNYSNL
jgi:cold-inducible RNA-binding protein